MIVSAALTPALAEALSAYSVSDLRDGWLEVVHEGGWSLSAVEEEAVRAVAARLGPLPTSDLSGLAARESLG